MVGKPVIVSRVVDSMTGNLRPTRAEATVVANAILNGTDGILLGEETLQDRYLIETVDIVGRICAETLLALCVRKRHNSCDTFHSSAQEEMINSSNRLGSTSESDEHVYIDSYPKLRAWYCENKSCIASTLCSV